MCGWAAFLTRRKPAPYKRSPPALFYIIVNALLPVGSERACRADAAHSLADDLVVERRAEPVTFVVHRTVRSYAEACRRPRAFRLPR